MSPLQRACTVLSVLLITLSAAGCSTVASHHPPEQDTRQERANITPAQRYLHGMALLQAGQYENAAAQFIDLLRNDSNTAPGSDLASKARLALAYCQLQLGQPQQSVQLVTPLLQNPVAKQQDYALYLRANALLSIAPAPSEAQVRQAAEDLQALARQYPHSAFTLASQQTQQQVQQRLAENTLARARHEMQLKHYAVAVNLCRDFVERYPDHSGRHEALTMLVSAYQHLGLTDLADSTRALLNPKEN